MNAVRSSCYLESLRLAAGLLALVYGVALMGQQTTGYFVGSVFGSSPTAQGVPPRFRLNSQSIEASESFPVAYKVIVEQTHVPTLGSSETGEYYNDHIELLTQYPNAKFISAAGPLPNCTLTYYDRDGNPENTYTGGDAWDTYIRSEDYGTPSGFTVYPPNPDARTLVSTVMANSKFSPSGSFLSITPPQAYLNVLSPTSASVSKTQYKFSLNSGQTDSISLTWFEAFFPSGSKVPLDLIPKSIVLTPSSPESPPTTIDPLAIDSSDPNTLSRHPTQSGSYRVVLGVELAVDANRDGQIAFASEGTSDVTTQNRPYLFWLNNDDDTSTADTETAPIARADNTRFQISAKRNLEDFARLWINVGGLQDSIATGRLLVGLKWQEGYTGTPAINIYPSCDPQGSVSYLQSVTAAQAQISGIYNQAVVDKSGKHSVDTNGLFILPLSFWSGLSVANHRKCLLFEGAGQGTGKLEVVITDQAGNVLSENTGVWLDIEDVKTMYQQFRATPATLSRPFDDLVNQPFDANQVGFEAYPGRPIFKAAVDETAQVLVFVNGSNETYPFSTSVAETIFKRLWWQGYHGRLVSFRWETLVGLDGGVLPAHYNLNEWVAWTWGKGLSDFVASSNIPSGYSVSVAAHSLGNTVVASALQRGMRVKNVLMFQGAIPAGVFDTSAAVNGYAPMLEEETEKPTPDFAASLGYRGFVSGAGGAAVYSFFNVNDYALVTGPAGAWEGNQELNKPDPLDVLTSVVVGAAYAYDATTPGLLVTQRGALQNLGSNNSITSRYVATAYESMSFVARSRSRALGGIVTSGVIQNNVNIGIGSDTDLQDARSDHSGEFSRSIQQLQVFYRTFLIDIGGTTSQ